MTRPAGPDDVGASGERRRSWGPGPSDAGATVGGTAPVAPFMTSPRPCSASQVSNWSSTARAGRASGRTSSSRTSSQLRRGCSAAGSPPRAELAPQALHLAPALQAQERAPGVLRLAGGLLGRQPGEQLGGPGVGGLEGGVQVAVGLAAGRGRRRRGGRRRRAPRAAAAAWSGGGSASTARRRATVSGVSTPLAPAGRGIDRAGPGPGAQRRPQAVDVDAAPVGDLHDVLVADELAGVLADHLEGGLGGAGPALGGVGAPGRRGPGPPGSRGRAWGPRPRPGGGPGRCGPGRPGPPPAAGRPPPPRARGSAPTRRPARPRPHRRRRGRRPARPAGRSA